MHALRRVGIRFFIYSAAILLVVTAVAKLISSSGSARYLQQLDPIFGISFRQLFWIVGVLELSISLFCLFGKRIFLKIALVGWLATMFLSYRLSLFWLDWHRPCLCLGNLTDAIHISSQAADTLMKGVLIYLLAGSYGILFFELLGRKINFIKCNGSSNVIIDS